ncbi:hypothetical protein SFRURICE_010285 [Spodoptera frugiperda]|nr:hypothetical protein SFRURICE_010285 [Spodoptera frugiperda]
MKNIKELNFEEYCEKKTVGVFPLPTPQAACQLKEACSESSDTWTVEDPTRPRMSPYAYCHPEP